MCILCKNKKDIPFIPTSDVIQQGINRDSGLSNVYNIGNSVDVCVEPFNMPQFSMLGTIKPASGTTSGCSSFFTGTTSAHTCDAVYNLSELDDFEITFNFSGNTDYTGYTGYFCYTTFARSTSPSIRDQQVLKKSNSTLTRCFIYSGITGNTIVNTINKTDLPFRDEEYMIRPYNFYINKECAIGTILDTFLIEQQPSQFNYDTDWYYTTVVNPPVPILAFSNTSDTPLNNVSFRTELKTIEPGFSTVFTTDIKGLNNKYIVIVNGVTLTEGIDYNVDGRIITITSGYLSLTDTVQIAYLALSDQTLDIVNNAEQYLASEGFIMTGTTSGVTEANGTNFVNYNPSKNRYEVFLKNTVNEESDIFLVVNGVTLMFNSEFFLSTSDPQKLILDPSVVLGIDDAISIFYFTQNVFFRGNLGYLRTETPVINWYIDRGLNLPTGKGRFLLQVTTRDDKNFVNPLQSIYTDYIFGGEFYSAQLEPLGTNIEHYIYRVLFFKEYHAIFDNIITSRSESGTGSFSLNTEYIKNSY